MDLCDQERKPTGDKNRMFTQLLLLGLLRTLERQTAAITTCANGACPNTNLQLLSGMVGSPQHPWHFYMAFLLMLWLQRHWQQHGKCWQPCYCSKQPSNRKKKPKLDVAQVFFIHVSDQEARIFWW